MLSLAHLHLSSTAALVVLSPMLILNSVDSDITLCDATLDVCWQQWLLLTVEPIH